MRLPLTIMAELVPTMTVGVQSQSTGLFTNEVMHILAEIEPDPTAVAAEVSTAALRVTLSDGREVSAPLAWFPRLRDATPKQRQHWRLIGRGYGIHWPGVDEDVSVRALLGRPT